MLGNVGEWVEDCFNETYAGAPTDGAPWLTGNCHDLRMARGGDWWGVRAAYRGGSDPGIGSYGLRLARDLER